MQAIKYALLGLVGVIGMLVSMFGPVKVPFAESLAKSYYRYALGALLFILLVLLIFIGLFLYTFNANNFKSEIIQFVKDRTQRELVLQGDINVTFFPKLGLDSGKLSLSQRNSAKEFASINNARLYIAWWPLFKRQLVFDRVEISGIHANVIRLKDGSTNFDDLLISDEHLTPLTFDIDSVLISDSSINFHDELDAQRLALHDLRLETGHLADKATSNLTANFRLDSEMAHFDSVVHLKSRLFFDRKAGRYEFADLEGKLEGRAGQVSDLVLNFKANVDSYPAQNSFTVDDLLVSANGMYAERRIEAKLGVPKLKISGHNFSGTLLTLDAALPQPDENLKLVLQLPAFAAVNRKFSTTEASADFDYKGSDRALGGKLTSSLSINFEAAPKMQLDSIVLALSGTHPVLSGEVSANAKGALLVDYAGQNAKLAFDVKVDESKFKGSVALKDFSHPAYAVEFNANRLDLDRYFSAEWMKRLFDESTIFNTANFKNMVMQGSFRAGEVVMYKYKASNLAANISINQSMITFSPLSARLYGGISSGSVSITAHEMPTISVKQNIRGLHIGAILSKTASAGRLGGKGSIDLDISAQGNSMVALRKALSGSASMVLTHGYLAGANLTSALIEGKADLGTSNIERSIPAKFSELTDFSELRTMFAFNDNLIRSTGIEIKSPFIRTAGQGVFDLDAGNIDLQLNATVANSIGRRTGGELFELRGITVPIRVSGPFSSPNFAFDFASASGGNIAKFAAAVEARAAAKTDAASTIPVQVRKDIAKKSTPSKSKKPVSKSVRGSNSS